MSNQDEIHETLIKARSNSLTGQGMEDNNMTARMLKKIRDSKRRGVQQMMEQCFNAESSDDSEFEKLKARQSELYRYTKTTLLHMRNHLNATMAFSNGFGKIGAQCILLKEETAGTKSSPAMMALSASMTSIEAKTKEVVDKTMSNIIEGIQKKVNEMRDLKRQIEQRDALKIDFDSSVRKLRKVRERGNDTDISRREIKLKYAQDALYLSTDVIVKRLELYDSKRTTFLDVEMEMFRQIQMELFSHGTKVLGNKCCLKIITAYPEKGRVCKDDPAQRQEVASPRMPRMA